MSTLKVRNSSPMLIELDGSGRIAIITLNRPTQKNVLHPEDYEALAEALYEIDQLESVAITLLQGNGSWFCAGTFIDGSSSVLPPGVTSRRRHQISKLSGLGDLSRALYTHRKILVAALNGPVVGVAAALIGQFDLIYAAPTVWMAVPFVSLGLVPEAGSSVTFINRMGLAKANEVLLWGKKTTAEELLQCGFINKIFPVSSVPFQVEVLSHLVDLSTNLDPAALLATKSLIKAGLHDAHNQDAVSLRESSTQIARFMSGGPSKRFEQIARGEWKPRL